MTDRCESARPRPFSASRDSCEPTPEETARKSSEDERRNAAEAESRRNAYLASGADVGGRASRAASDARAYDPWTSDDPKLKDSLRTAAIDPPLQDDVVGNMLVGAAAGGVGAGVRSLAFTSSLSAGASGAADGAATALLKSTAKTIALESLKPSDPPQATPLNAEPKASSTPYGGMSSPRGASIVAPEPSSSQPDAVLGPLVIRG